MKIEEFMSTPLKEMLATADNINIERRKTYTKYKVRKSLEDGIAIVEWIIDKEAASDNFKEVLTCLI